MHQYTALFVASVALIVWPSGNTCAATRLSWSTSIARVAGLATVEQGAVLTWQRSLTQASSLALSLHAMVMLQRDLADDEADDFSLDAARADQNLLAVFPTVTSCIGDELCLLGQTLGRAASARAPPLHEGNHAAAERLGAEHHLRRLAALAEYSGCLGAHKLAGDLSRANLSPVHVFLCNLALPYPHTHLAAIAVNAAGQSWARRESIFDSLHHLDDAVLTAVLTSGAPSARFSTSPTP